jgi:hypothetical protein
MLDEFPLLDRTWECPRCLEKALMFDLAALWD